MYRHYIGFATLLTAFSLIGSVNKVQAVTFDFTSGDNGGFVSTGLPWSYTGTEWRNNGAGFATTGSLTSPILYVNSSSVDLSFTHALGFENGFDGGQVRLSINNGSFNLFNSFTVNGYSSLFSGTGNPIAGQSAFTGGAPGGTSFFTSGGSIPGLNPGDTIQIRFLGGWDTSTNFSGPDWRINSLNLSNTSVEPITNPEPVPENTSLISLFALGGIAILNRKMKKSDSSR